MLVEILDKFIGAADGCTQVTAVEYFRLRIVNLEVAGGMEKMRRDHLEGKAAEMTMRP